MSNETDSLPWDALQAAIHTWITNASGLADDHVWYEFEGKPRPSAPYIAVHVQLVRPIGHDWEIREWNTLTFATLTVSAVSTTFDTLTITAHGLNTGDGPIQIASTGTLPGGLAPLTDYWVIKVDADTIQLASSYVATGGQQPLGAGNPRTPIHFTTAGTGTITIDGTPDTLPAGKEIARRAQGFREMTLHLECFGVEGTGTNAMRILTNVMSAIQFYTYDLDQAGFGVSDFGQSFAQGGVQHLEGRRGSILEPRAMTDVVGYLASDLVGAYLTMIETIDPITMPIPAGSFSSGFSSGFGG